MPTLNEALVLDALRQVEDPDLRRDIVALGFVQNMRIDGGRVSFDVVLTTPACPVKDQLKAACELYVGKLPGVTAVEARMTSNVTTLKDKGAALLPGVRNTIAVASGKGGVGKSTVAVNLAVALARLGARVGLIDADIYGPSIPTMLGLHGVQPRITAAKKMIPLEAFGIKLMSIGFLIDPKQAVVWRGPMASSALKQFMSDVEWGELDYLLYDLPPGTGDIHLTLVQSVPLTGAVIVTTPQDVALADVRKSVGMFRNPNINVPVLGVIENMSYFIAPDTGTRYDIFGCGGGSRYADEIGVPFLGENPIDSRIARGGDAGRPIVADEPDSVAAHVLTKLAEAMAQQVSIRNAGLAPTKRVEILYS